LKNNIYENNTGKSGSELCYWYSYIMQQQQEVLRKIVVVIAIVVILT